MYKVLIVDDEPWILKGIKASCNWEEHNCVIAYSTTDSVLAFNYIVENNPDIVITDIQMDEMTGIEMMRRTRAKGIYSEFVVISGYSKFDYAKDAIKYGAFDYLLKPVSKDELNTIVKELVHKLDSEGRKNNLSTEELFDQLMYHSGKYNIGDLIGLEKDYMNQGNNQIIISNCSNLLNETDIKFSIFELGPKKFIYFLNVSEDIFYNILSEKGAKIGVSEISKEIDSFHHLFKQADIAYSESFIQPKQTINHYKKNKVSESSSFVTSIINSIDKKEIISTLPDFAIKTQLNIEDITFIYNQIILYINYNYFSATNSNPLPLLCYEEIYENFLNLSELTEYISGLIDTVDVNSFKQIEEGFKNILEYIDCHYNEGINLKILSNKFSYAATYICQLFKRNINMTFTEYIVKIRMDRACKLLVTTDKKIMEIASEVGYGDYCYFSKLFKKSNGVTPFEYRKNGKK